MEGFATTERSDRIDGGMTGNGRDAKRKELKRHPALASAWNVARISSGISGR